MTGTDAALMTAIGERLLLWRQGGYYWGDAIAYDALLAGADLLGTGWSAELATRLTKWADDAVDSFDDALAPGRTAAELVRRGLLDERVLHRIVRAITRLDSSDGIPLLRPQVPEWRALVWVDSIYHIPSGLAAAGVVLGDDALVERGVAVARDTLAQLETDAAVGHAWDSGLRRATGVEWTRGIGWALLGLLDTCELAPDAAAAAGLDVAAARLLRALERDQRPNGHWPTVLGRADADDETSLAGFWLAAAAHPASPGTDPAVSARAAEALRRQVAEDGTVLGVSHDTHVRSGVEEYLHPATLPSPWGQGAALRGLVTRNAEGAA
ncbi:glycoside hydrolase family 88 protein [Micromonospora sp. NPDC005113]